MSNCLPKWLSHSHQQWMKIPVAPHSHPHLVLVFQMLALLTGVWWYFIVLICNFLTTYNVEDLVICLLAYLLWWGVCLDMLPIFKLGHLFSYCWTLRVFVYFGYKLFIRYVFDKCFLPVFGFSVHSFNNHSQIRRV